jgi:two-component system OmpR family sensor kinase
MLTLEGVMRTEFGEGLDLQGAVEEASVEVVAPDRTLVVARADGTVLAIWGRPLPSAWRPSVDASTLESLAIGPARFRVMSRPVTYSGYHCIGVLVALGVAAAGGWLVGRQTLRPLTDMATQATSISERDLFTRLHAPSNTDELGQFAAAFNALLDRLATALHGQQQFMADASHELRTPVSVVRTTTQVTLARAGRTEDEYQEAFAIVAEQSARLARLVDAMFLLSRAEAQGIPLVREPLYLDDLVADRARALRVFADERGLTVRTNGDGEVAFSGDNMLLRQMVGNVLDNAIRHAKPGGTVDVSVRRTASGVTIRITDHGAGIPAGDRERIFQRFVRLDAHAGGAGLGLPIARWIAEAHGGRLVVESSNPDGTPFAVTLPVA